MEIPFPVPLDIAALLFCKVQVYFTKAIVLDLIGCSSMNALRVHRSNFASPRSHVTIIMNKYDSES